MVYEEIKGDNVNYNGVLKRCSASCVVRLLYTSVGGRRHVHTAVGEHGSSFDWFKYQLSMMRYTYFSYL